MTLNPAISSSNKVVYLVRHATPDWTMTNIPYHLPPGPPLNDQGHGEALLLRAYLRLVGVGLVASSPLERCLQTARLVTDSGLNGHPADPIPLETWPALMELQPNESTESMHARFWPSFEAAWALTNKVCSVALITHGGPITFLLETLGMDPQQLKREYDFDHNNPVPPAGAWRITRLPQDAPWQMDLVFLPGHLPKTSPGEIL